MSNINESFYNMAYQHITEISMF